MPPKTLIVLTGPTAIGKTELAIEVAKHFNTEIISADSRQFYKEMSIGIAKPTEAELQGVSHHFVGHLSVTDYYNVSRFEQDVLRLLDRLFKKHDYVVMAGGSGLYIDAVCHGIDEFPDADEKLRAKLNKTLAEQGIEALRQKLKELDPEYYKAVDRNNPKRLMRAIEVCMLTGKKYSELRKKESPERDFRILKIGLNTEREKLFERINRRVDKMIQAGLIDEVRSLEKYRHLNALNTVGYKEIFAFLDGIYSREKAIEKIKTNTRRYAKRQLTWFRRDEEIHWYEPAESRWIIDFILQQ